jgi:hypothetical protein
MATTSQLTPQVPLAFFQSGSFTLCLNAGNYVIIPDGGDWMAEHFTAGKMSFIWTGHTHIRSSVQGTFLARPILSVNACHPTISGSTSSAFQRAIQLASFLTVWCLLSLLSLYESCVRLDLRDNRQLWTWQPPDYSHREPFPFCCDPSPRGEKRTRAAAALEPGTHAPFSGQHWKRCRWWLRSWRHGMNNRLLCC